MQQSLYEAYHKGCLFIQTAIVKVTSSTTIPSPYLVSAAPIPTALALMALATLQSEKLAGMEHAGKYLAATRLPSGWGNTPAGPVNELATAICTNALNCLERGALSRELIHDSACLVARTWTQDFDRLAPDWLPKQDSPVLKLLQALVGRQVVPTLETIRLKDLKSLSHFMPPYGRPTLLAVTLIKEINRCGLNEETRAAALELCSLISPDGSWCQDIMVTSMSVLALYLAEIDQPLAKACDWLCSVQYDHGGWPSFNQLFNWAVGWAAHLLPEEDPKILEYTTPYLLQALNLDDSLGSTPPFSYPDLDDTAIGLLGLAMDPKVPPDKLEKIRDLLLRLQNWDGSWSTFPSFSGLPPDCRCDFPVYIKSEDVTTHVLQALLKLGLPRDHSQIGKGLNWLLKRQNTDGTWDSTWFLGKTYATAQVLDLLLQLEPHSSALARGLRYLKFSQCAGHWDTASAGETGLALHTLLKAGMVPTSPVIQKGLEYLISLQQPDGSFRPFYSGFYASRLYYEEPLSEGMAALRAIKLYLRLAFK